MDKMISSCGLNCAGCEAFQATKTNDIARKAQIAIDWSKRYDAALTADDINCEGCREAGLKFSWCNKCPIRACVVSKGYGTCAECEELPCQINSFLFEAVPEAMENLKELMR
jgi:hypothetical protein